MVAGSLKSLFCALQVTRLRYTPRKFVVHPDHSTLIVAESDHAAVPAAERRVTEDGMETDGQQTEVWLPNQWPNAVKFLLCVLDSGMVQALALPFGALSSLYITGH